MLQHRAPLEHERVVGALEDATEAFVATVGRVEQWDAPGLGEWSVRELVGHTLRAFTTVETYLAAEPVTDVVADSTVYYRMALGNPGVHASVAQRGREAGRALTDPVATVAETSRRVLELVRAASRDQPAHTPFGRISLTEYLATRTIELTVHTLDLQRALGLEPSIPDSSVDVCLEVLLPLAGRTRLLLALTGRDTLNVLG